MPSYPRWALGEQDKIRANNLLIRMVAPAIVEPGELFALRVSVVGADQMPAEFPVRLRFLDPEGWKGLPPEVEVRGEPVRLEGVSLANPGAYWLWASFGADPQHRVASNPVLCQESPRARIYFGDLHVHTLDGDCQPYLVKEPRFAFDYIRHVSFLDFSANTDHVHGLTASKWERQKALVREYDRPGEFVPFLAFESSHASGFGGDNNGYYRDFEGDYFWIDHPEMSSTNAHIPLDALWRFMQERPYPSMTIPHHTGRAQKHRSWEDGWYNPDHEWLYEIYSCWGSSEERMSRYPILNGNSAAPAYFRDALVRGCRFGVIASGDDHITMPNGASQQGPPGSPRYGLYRHKGLAAVLASRLDRNALWEGFQSRATYATTFDRSILLFDADGVPAGSEIEVSSESQSARRLSLRFLAGTPRHNAVQVTLIRNDQVLCTSERFDAGKPLEWQFLDEEPFEKVAIREARYRPEPFVAYYVRVDYPMGGSAWSSPIWFWHR
jgi:hypothetical protein